ncbi:MAG: tRNA-dihydrouridine synthase family protein [Candidatus Micrarchaeota archaeon]
MHRSYLAPIADYTDLPFRLLCQKYGAESTCVPLISSDAIERDESKTALSDAHLDERNLGIQLFGNKSRTIGVAAGRLAKRYPFVSWFNLNCGCPSSRTMNAGAGSAMLDKPELIAESISLMKKMSEKPVSAKIRIFGGETGTIALCRKIDEAGADFIIIHGRTVGQGYSGKADWELIRRIRECIGIPVIGNGDIASASEGFRRVRDGYCDSFMAGRAAMRNPMLFSDRNPKTASERFALLEEYAALHERYLGEPELRVIKLKAINLLHGIERAAEIRLRICKAASTEDIFALKDE